MNLQYAEDSVTVKGGNSITFAFASFWKVVYLKREAFALLLSQNSFEKGKGVQVRKEEATHNFPTLSKWWKTHNSFLRNNFHKKGDLRLAHMCAKRGPSFLWKLLFGYNVEQSIENSIGPVHDLS